MLISATRKLLAKICRAEDETRQRPSLTPHIATMAIVNALRERKPFLACRLGWFEAYATGHFDRFGQITDALRAKMWNTPGIFPPTDDEFRKFHAEFTAAAGSADLVGLMHCPFEAEVLRRWCPKAFTCELQDLEPYYNPLPWSSALEGQRVLVVHPFAETISQQYPECRDSLFADTRVLPQFELLTLKPPQTLCGNTAGFGSWSEALSHTREKIAKLDFDVAIVGCGAYGLPLGAFVKKLGRPCIHLGGAVQTLFGVIGARWLKNNPVALYVNAHWRHPSDQEKPPNWQQAEGGCYW